MVLCCGRTGGVAQVWRGWVFGDWFAGRIKGKSVFTPMQWKNMNQKMPEDWRSRQTIFIAQRFYSSFPPSLFRLILTLQLKNAYPGLRRFLENFLCVRESPGGAWREGRVLFLSLRHSRLALSKAEKNFKELNLWDNRQCKGIFIQRLRNHSTFVL